MSKLTIKYGCVEAVFKRGRARRKINEGEQRVTTERQPTTPTVEPQPASEPKAIEYGSTETKG